MEDTLVRNKQLEKFEPFNEIWYKNCYYAALFTVMQYYGADINSVLCNSVGVYKYNHNTDLKLDYESLSMKTVKDILLENNILLEHKLIDSECLINEIEYSINNERPVIIPIDCFYEPIRKDTYLKRHLGHCISIFGYDSEKKVVYIMEHEYADSLNYDKRELAYDNLCEAYQGYMESKYYNSEKPELYQEFSRIDNSSTTESTSYNKERFSFISLIKEKYDHICLGIEDLNLFADEFKKYIDDEALITNNIDSLIMLTNSIFNGKNLERYCLLKEAPEYDISSIEEIIFCWSFIRGIIVRYKYSHVHNVKLLEKCIEKIYKLIDLEKKYYLNIAKMR